MYLLAAGKIDIDCSMARAYGFASNLERFPEWFPGVMAIVSGNDIPHGSAGKVYHETVHVPLLGSRRVRIRVVQAEPPRSLITEGDLPALLPRMEIHVASLAENRCTLEWRMYSRRKRGWSRFLILPLAAIIMRRRVPHALARLKSRLEAE